MIRNFFKITWRNLLRYKSHSIINISGLTIGLACSVLIFMIVREELSFDKFHQKKDRLYRINYFVNDLEIARVPVPLAQAVAEYIPEAEYVSRFFSRSATIIIQNNNLEESFEENNIYFADSAIFSMFTFEIIKGSLSGFNQQSLPLVISDRLALKYFGNDDAIGKTMAIDGANQGQVIAVAKSFPTHSSFQFDIVLPYEAQFVLEASASRKTLRDRLYANWIASHSPTYILLHENADVNKVNEKLQFIYNEHVPEEMKVGQVWKLEPLSDIHLYSQAQAQDRPSGNINTVIILISIGIMTLIIASINFVNLSTARAEQRSREIGVRKSVGALKSQLISQFLGESVFLAYIAMGFALLMSYYLLPVLNEVTDGDFTYSHLINSNSLIFIVIIPLITGVMAGLYPAIFLSRLNTVFSLKGSGFSHGSGSFSLRQFLVGFQFFISLLLIGGSITIFRQLDFIRSKDIGFSMENIVNVPLFSQNFNNVFGRNDTTLFVRLETFRNEVQRSGAAINVSMSSGPVTGGAVFRGAIPEGYTAEDKLFVATIGVDEHFLNIYKIKLLAGRSFESSKAKNTSTEFIINETALTEYNLGKPEDALGKSFAIDGFEGIIIGVTNDFHFTPLQNEITPLVLYVNPNSFNLASVQLRGKDIASEHNQVKEIWENIFPEKAFEANFLTEQVNNFYTREEQIGNLISGFASMAIIISCLGSYGLILFIVNRKRKEVSIRKVLGAEIGNLTFSLFDGFFMVLIIAALIFAPAQYLLMDSWLSGFIYRIPMDFIAFAVPILLMAAMITMTIIWQVIKAVRVNPAASLRSE